jgi:hypothetical protein
MSYLALFNQGAVVAAMSALANAIRGSHERVIPSTPPRITAATNSSIDESSGTSSIGQGSD